VRDRLVVAYPYGPEDLLSYRSVDEVSNSILRNAYEPLVDLTADLRLFPCLAESWYNPDELTWVFRLRSGVRLHDGRTLTANHVAEFLRRVQTDPRSLRSAGTAIESVAALGPLSVRIRTSRPVGWLPAQLARLLVGLEAERAGAPPIGTGPYVVRNWSARGDTQLEAFPGHRQGPPAIASLEFRAIADPRQAAERLRAGDVDLMLDVPLDEWPGLRRPGIRTFEQPGLRVVYLGLNTLRGRSARENPLRDVRVRRAIAHALDLPGLLAGALGGAAAPAPELIPPQVFGFHGGLDGLPYRPDESRRLLAEAKVRFPKPLSLDWEKGRHPGIDAAAGMIASGLGAVGIPVRARPREPGAIVPREKLAELDLFLRGWLNSSGDAGASYEYLLHTPGQAGQGSLSTYSNPAVDRELAEAARPAPAEQRRRHFVAVAEIAHEDVAVVPLFRPLDRYAFNASLRFEPRLDRRIRAFEMRWQRGADQ
jgi:peptide/nickel transport system substrate-binding protein